MGAPPRPALGCRPQSFARPETSLDRVWVLLRRRGDHSGLLSPSRSPLPLAHTTDTGLGILGQTRMGRRLSGCWDQGRAPPHCAGIRPARRRGRTACTSIGAGSRQGRPAPGAPGRDARALGPQRLGRAWPPVGRTSKWAASPPPGRSPPRRPGAALGSVVVLLFCLAFSVRIATHPAVHAPRTRCL